MKIVETNISYSSDRLEDHQTRIIEVPSWNEYCDLFRNYNGDCNGRDYKCVFSSLLGCVMPKNTKILDLRIDDSHLTCHFQLWNGIKEYKLAYVIER